MNTKHILAALAFASAMPWTASAQDLTTEITVESEAEIQLPPASPLKSVFPAAIDAKAPEINLLPAVYSEAADFAPSAGKVFLSPFSGIARRDGRRGYLRAGYFPTYNAGAEAGYRFIDTEASEAGIAAAFHGSSYKSPAGYDYGRRFATERRNVSDNTVSVQAYGSHSFSPLLKLGAELSYFHSWLSSPTLWDFSQKQKIGAFDASLAMSGRGRLHYALKLAYRSFGLSDDIGFSSSPAGTPGSSATAAFQPASDKRFRVDFSTGGSFGADSAQHLGIAVDFDLLHRRGNEPDAFDIRPVDHASSAILGLTPAYTLSRGRFSLKLGARFDIGFNSPDKAFHVAPDVMAAWKLSHVFTAYVKAGGGERFSTLRDRYSYSPFAPGLTASSRTFTPVEGRLGIGLRPLGGLSVGVWAAYASVRRMPMLALFDNLLTYVPVGLHGWTVGLDAAYKWGDIVAIDARARLYPHSYSGGSPYAPDRARCVAEVKATVKPVERLAITLDYTLRASRRYYSYTLTSTGPQGDIALRRAHDMGNISELGLGGTYEIADNFDVFVRLENLLCRRVMVLPTVYTQRLHGLAGVAVRF